MVISAPLAVPTATKTKKSAFIGKGAFVQFLGVVCCFFFFPFGLIAGIMMLLAGSAMSFIYRCSNCGNRVDKEARICPHHNCGAHFDR